MYFWGAQGTNQNAYFNSYVVTASGQVVHTVEANTGFSGMKRLGTALLPPGWDASPSQGYAQHSPAPIYTPGWREEL